MQWAIPAVAVVVIGLAIAALSLSSSRKESTRADADEFRPDPWEVISDQARTILGEDVAALVTGSVPEGMDNSEGYAQFVRLSVAVTAVRIVAEIEDDENLALNWLCSESAVFGEAALELLHAGRYHEVIAAAQVEGVYQ